MGIISYLKEEIRIIRERDPALKSGLEVFLYPGFKAVLSYRFTHRLYLKKHYFITSYKGSSRLLSRFLPFCTMLRTGQDAILSRKQLSGCAMIRRTS